MVGKGTGTLVPEVFFRCEEMTRERKKRREKTSGCGRCESHYHSTIGVNYTSQDRLTSNQCNNTPVS